jgi:hypothetical protein
MTKPQGMTHDQCPLVIPWRLVIVHWSFISRVGPYLSHPPWQNDRMKNMFARLVLREKCRVIATFGQAQLIATSGGGFELRGGTVSDRLAAREWISFFLHEAAPRLVPGT